MPLIQSPSDPVWVVRDRRAQLNVIGMSLPPARPPTPKELRCTEGRCSPGSIININSVFREFFELDAPAHEEWPRVEEESWWGVVMLCESLTVDPSLPKFDLRVALFPHPSYAYPYGYEMARLTYHGHGMRPALESPSAFVYTPRMTDASRLELSGDRRVSTQVIRVSSDTSPPLLSASAMVASGNFEGFRDSWRRLAVRESEPSVPVASMAWAELVMPPPAPRPNRTAAPVSRAGRGASVIEAAR